MRTLGPGSVSSFLKIVVEVIYVALLVLLAVQLIAAAALLVFQPFTATVIQFDPHRLIPGHPLKTFGRPTQLALLLFVVALYVAVLAVVFNRLRRVFDTLTRGDPFHPHNVGRLQAVGAALAGLEGLGYLVRLTARWAEPSMVHPALSVNFTAWFAILVVFVLAEVFREGARLRAEAELTV